MYSVQRYDPCEYYRCYVLLNIVFYTILLLLVGVDLIYFMWDSK